MSTPVYPFPNLENIKQGVKTGELVSWMGQGRQTGKTMLYEIERMLVLAKLQGSMIRHYAIPDGKRHHLVPVVYDYEQDQMDFVTAVCVAAQVKYISHRVVGSVWVVEFGVCDDFES